jgi:hypothetical protein
MTVLRQLRFLENIGSKTIIPTVATIVAFNPNLVEFIATLVGEPPKYYGNL